jgi:YggT family protein
MLGPLADAIARIIEIILNMIQLLIIASILISWVGADPNNQIVMIVRNLTEPLLRPFRKLTRNLPGPIDWSPLLVLLLIIFIQYGVVPYIRMLGGPAAGHG